MTSYTLRSASPAKTRADAVVVGVVPDRQGRRARAPAREDVAKAYGRKLRPLLATLGVTGKAGEVVKVPDRAARSPLPLLVLVGLGQADRRTPYAVRRAAGVAARVAHQRRVGRARPARRRRRAGARRDRGLRARRLHVHDVQEGLEDGPDGARRRSSC